MDGTPQRDSIFSIIFHFCSLINCFVFFFRLVGNNLIKFSKFENASEGFKIKFIAPD